MTPSDLDRFRDLLSDLDRDIRIEIDQDSAADSSISPDNAIGRLTRMEAIQAQSISNAGKSRLGKRLLMIKSALEAIDNGSYGTCVTCGDSIPAGRLEIRPESRLCVKCASR
jgi:DnaK suppressor protein